MKTLVVCSVLFVAAPLLRADSALFVGTSGNLAASANFDFSGNVLSIRLTNTASVSPNASNQVLTGVFFDLTGNPALTPVSAILPGGSSIIQTSQCNANPCAGVTNVGGEFSYAAGGLGSLAGTDRGISSSGYLNANTSSGNFNGLNLDNPNALDGINFGIVTSNFAAFSGNGGLDNDALVRNSVVFTLNGVLGLNAASVSSVYFTYGTSQPGEPNFPGTTTVPSSVPEPTSVLLLGTVLGGVVHLIRKRRTA